MNVFDTLEKDYYYTGSCRFLVINDKDEFSIKRIRPYETVLAEVYYDDLFY